MSLVPDEEGQGMLGQKKVRQFDGAPERRLVNGVIGSLKTAWLQDDVTLAVVERLRVLAPRSQLVFAIECQGANRQAEDELPCVPSSVSPAALSPEYPVFCTLRGLCDRTPNEVVTSTAMSRRDKRRFERARSDLFRHHHLWHLMGATLSSQNERLATVLFARAKAWGDFKTIERWRLSQILPYLRDGLLSRSALSRTPLRAKEAAALISCFGSPASIHSQSGEMLCCNEAAQEAWTGASNLPPRLGSASPRVTREFVDLDGERRYLIVHRHRTRRAADLCSLDRLSELPSSLSQIAKLILKGLSDKEISNEVDLSVSTVRTYTYRIYKRIGVRGRGQLLSEALSTTRESHLSDHLEESERSVLKVS